MSVSRSGVPKSVSNTPMYDPIRYKTEMCKNFAELGVCRWDDRCFYAHSEAELRPVTYKHRKHKTQLCKPFHRDGYCDFGARCAFIHSQPDIDAIVRQLNHYLETTSRQRNDSPTGGRHSSPSLPSSPDSRDEMSMDSMSMY